jgi:hypothetical protein
MSGKEKAGVLLRILGIGDQLAALDREERAAYDERTAQGRVADQKAKYAAEMPEHHDCPDAPVSAGELVAEAQAVMARNAERQAARQQASRIQDDALAKQRAFNAAERRVTECERMLSDARHTAEEASTAYTAALERVNDAAKAPVTADESTADIERRMGDLEVVNAKVRANLDKRKAIEDAETAIAEYARLTAAVEAVRARRAALLDGATMPLPGLSVDAGELTYAGKAWDCMSSAEQIRAGVAIVRRLRPECGFVLLDGLERMDLAQLADLGAWLQAEGLQAIATRVSRGDECSIIIEDGLVVGQNDPAASPSPAGAVEAEW